MLTQKAQAIECVPFLGLTITPVAQVKNAMGDWTAVTLKENEVMVVRRYTSSHR